MIVGSAAPIPILAFRKWWKVAWLVTQLVSLTLGTMMCFLSNEFSTDRTYVQRAFIYCFIGLLNTMFLAEYRRIFNGVEQLMLAELAIGYVAGAMMYARQWPNPWPAVFGYHECFHALCLLSAIMTYGLNLSVIRRHDADLL